jgi:hypothetical protein
LGIILGKLNIKALAVAMGAMWGVGMLFLGWASMLGWGVKAVGVMSSVYIGFSSSLLGGIIGAVWGFLDGVIGGAIIAIIYNMIAGGNIK